MTHDRTEIEEDTLPHVPRITELSGPPRTDVVNVYRRTICNQRRSFDDSNPTPEEHAHALEMVAEAVRGEFSV